MANDNVLDVLTASIPTPFLLVDEAIVRKNIRQVQDYADHHGFAVRPHVKTHKSLRITRMQLDAGAVGVAVAKVGEAEVMSAIENLDILVAYPAVGAQRAGSLARLAQHHKISVAADTEYLIEELAHAAGEQATTIGILIMFDAGLHRCGVADPGQLTRLARLAATRKGLRFDGIQIYLGHLYGDAARSADSYDAINRLWEPAHDTLCAAGLRPRIVSSGSTPSLFNTHRVRHVNEIRVGTAVYQDAFSLKFGHCTLEDCAVRVVATVVSDVVPGQVIIDAGAKALSAKPLLRNENLEMGFIPEYPEARIFRLHEEHGWVDVSRCPKPPQIGQRLSIVPVAVSHCVNQYDTFYLLTTHGEFETEPVDARGCYV
ncbi:alanine racemase [Desulfosarcina ovata]|uniref:Alanine racemase n=1 Tax=Desulfosarcina ovata subsp. ovata TaxID=2752305 RepID=A0A5K8AA98_9BACT|nr:alanine racemase [Desulfosarcina ovata]BBO89507.1 alanine racemase [Desulfosarcina ovata subsp. ovata]